MKNENDKSNSADFMVEVNADDLISVLRGITQGNYMEFLVAQNYYITTGQHSSVQSLMEAWVKHNAEVHRIDEGEEA